MPIVRPAGKRPPVPYWLKPDQLGKQPYSTINARSDRIQTGADLSRTLQEAAVPGADDRLVRVAEDQPKAKRPFHFQPKATPFAFGGVYDVWKGDGKPAIHQLLDRHHGRGAKHCGLSRPHAAGPGRKPVRGLDARTAGDGYRDDETVPRRDRGLEVGAAVGNVRNNPPELIERVTGLL